MKKLGLIVACCLSMAAQAQELYVFSEPASNMPAHSVGVRQQVKRVASSGAATGGTRSSSEIMFGASKNFMWHLGFTLSDMYSSNFRAESFRAYGKYRFFSQDDLYKHLRMAAFAEFSLSQNPLMFDEISLEGDQSGFQSGLIITQLLHKLAISAIGSYISVAGKRSAGDLTPNKRNAVSYSLSAGYLLFPVTYKNYDQTNVNLYLELLGQQSTIDNRYFTDLAPALQFIFNSQAKVNFGYRYQLSGNMLRMGTEGWLLGMEWLFLRKPKPFVSN